jgi:hypothetical protein
MAYNHELFARNLLFCTKACFIAESSCKANSRLSSQEIVRFLWNQRIQYMFARPATGHCPLQDESPPYSAASEYFHNNHFNVQLPSTLESPKWFVSFRFFG